MKKFILIVLAGLFLSACGGSESSENNNTDGSNKKMTEFLSNFQELSFPIEINKEGFDSDTPSKIIESEFIDLISDGDSEEEYNSENYTVKFFYAGKKILPNKDFDIFIVFEEPNPSRTEIFPVYTLYTISKAGKVINQIMLAEQGKSAGVIGYNDATINSNLEIVQCNFFKEWELDGETQIPETFTKTIETYIIDENGIVKKQQSDELTGLDKFSQFYEKVNTLNLPFTFDETYNNKDVYLVDLDKFDFLKKINGLSGKTSKCSAIGKIDAAADFYLFLLKTWDDNIDMSDEVALYLISLDGEILSELPVGIGGFDESVSLTISKDLEISILKKSESEDYESTNILTKYTVSQTGNFVKINDETTNLDIFISDFSVTPDDQTFVKNSISKFNTINSSRQVADYMHNRIDKLTEIIQKGLDVNSENEENPEPFYYVEDLIPCVGVGYAAEASGIEAITNYYRLYEKAKNTPEKDDDLFFEAYKNGIKAFENYYTKKKYLVKFDVEECSDFETCYIILGGGKCYEALLKIDKAMVQESNFMKDLKDLKDVILRRTFIDYANYGYSKGKVLEYTDKILKDIKLTNEEKTKIETFKTAVKTKSDSDFSLKTD